MTDSGPRQPTILIIDDEPISLDMLRLALRGEYRIITATNGRDGLNTAAAELPDVILLDIVMPGMDGYEVCRELKSNQLLQDIPVLFITCMGEAENEFQGLEYGAVDYIIKPYNREIARMRVKTHLEIKKQRDILVNQAIELQQKNADQQILIDELKNEKTKVKILTGLLPICASCKKVRDDKGYWEELDSFISQNTGIEFSHCLCSDCASRLYPQFKPK